MFRTALNNSPDQGAAIARELREAGLKVTPQRVAIVTCLAGDRTHPTAQEIYDRLGPAFPGMAFATVYNTLSALMRVGRVSALSLGGATRFDPNMHPHDHTLCDRCGRVRDVPADSRAAAERGVPRAMPDFDVQRVERIYRGVCAECRSTGA